ncbi:unnamed protein product [Candidula unifasciata]|uniref:Cytochrome P450 n=1 Tax=Candidula unifasciata TaxID=100452 RepID=A0A8S3YK15_9EUPU|nr:unnamed protein product [Candidula unifasciata]
MELTTCVVAFVVFLVIYLWLHRSDPRLPPTPVRALPVVGHLFSLAQDTRQQFKQWRKQSGDIFSLYLGQSLVVVLNGYDLIKEALVKQAEFFSDRPPFFIDTVTGDSGKGVIFSSGALWKEQRSVSLSILRSFGMGKNVLAEKIQEEVDCYVKCLAGLKEKPTDIRLMTNISTSNIICSILIGRRFEYDDKQFQDLIHKLGNLSTEQRSGSVVNFFPWLRHLPGDIFKAKTLAMSTTAILKMLSGVLNEKKRQVVVDSNDVCNFIDAYIIERNKRTQAGVSTTLDDLNLLKITNDLFSAGTETTSTTIYWCILYMLNYPEVQKKVYEEIKDKVGTDRTPTIQDKTDLTYLRAVIMETQRLASIVPLSLTHMVSEKVTLRGYTLPKGTWILPNLDSVLHDKTTWGEDAMSFRPERFIDNDGKLKNPEQFIPFSIGRRACLGESLAKMELFLFLSNMFQRFQFLPADPRSIPSLAYRPAIVMTPHDYQVRVVERM